MKILVTVESEPQKKTKKLATVELRREGEGNDEGGKLNLGNVGGERGNDLGRWPAGCCLYLLLVDPHIGEGCRHARGDQVW